MRDYISSIKAEKNGMEVLYTFEFLSIEITQFQWLFLNKIKGRNNLFLEAFRTSSLFYKSTFKYFLVQTSIIL